ncbi:hypothetical protein [Streptomyces sp. NPDC014734]|uniref:hypothetical protein n=1 Tax=Streptomyces sp. NPDC014734 TaxID=3364886 RepID=UPI00370051D3
MVLIALLVMAAEVAVLIFYAVRRGSGAELPSLSRTNTANLLLATMATTAGFALTGNQETEAGDLMALVVGGCVLPTQAGAAVRSLVQRWTAADWLIACAGGLAVGSLNQNAPWPWS